MKNQSISTQSQDWVNANGNTEPFARFPVQILSLGLTKIQLEVFLFLSSKAGRDGRVRSAFPFSLPHIAEALDKFENRKKGIPNSKVISDAVHALEALGLLIISNSGINNCNEYVLTLPAGLKSRPISDRRRSPEYLAGQAAKRQAAREMYAQKAADKAAQNAPMFDVIEDPDDLPPVLEMWPEAAETDPLAVSHAFSSEDLPDEFVDPRNWAGVSDDDFDEEF